MNLPKGGSGTAPPTGSPPQQLMAQYMTLRDYFAAQWLVGMAGMKAKDGAAFPANYMATRAYKVADAMLKAREPTR